MAFSPDRFFEALRTRPPHFVVIGMQKAGTTWMHANLQRHPQIFMSPVKEMFHFRQGGIPAKIHAKYSRDLATLEMQLEDDPSSAAGVAWVREYVTATDRSDDWYRALFLAGAGRIAGEATPSYFYMPHDRIERLCSVIAGPKIVCLRHPVDRVLSQYRMDIASLDTGHSLAAFEAYLQSEHCRKVSVVAPQLDRWRDAAGDSLEVLFYDDLQTEPQDFLRALLEAINVNPELANYDAAAAYVNKANVAPLPDEAQCRAAARRALADDAAAVAERVGGHATTWAAELAG